MKLKKILKGIDASVDPRLSEADITSIFTNSKEAKPGGLFVAIEGFAVDGHKFVNEALRKGARAALVDKRKKACSGKANIIKVKDTRKALSVTAKNFYRSPSEKLTTIGITGTNGKTTTALLIESIFNQAGIPCGGIGTIEYRTGKRRIPAGRTTPDALGTNALLDKMLKNRLRAVAMEVSSHGLDQKRVDDIFFDAAIFTNLTHEHLDYHKNLKKYFESKARIFEQLKKGGFAVINTDDKNARSCIKKITNHKKITYGLNRVADISARVNKVGLGGSSFAVMLHKKDAFLVDTKLVGLHNISNILAAVAAAITQGLDFCDIKEGIEKVENIPGRLEPVEAGERYKVFVDYAHTHNALENVLKFLNQIKKKRIITVFGCGGDRDRKKRPLMGGVAQKFSDFAIIANDNPRSEKPERIASDIESGMKKTKANYAVILDRKKAIEKALKKARDGDIVLIAGKGHEKVQVIGEREIPFDDRKVAEHILESWK